MSILFDSVEINGMVIPNRIVRSATNDRMADASGLLNDRLISVYEALAAGGIGLIVTGYAYVTVNGNGGAGMLGVYDDHLIPGLKRMVEAVHQYDAKIALQINHAGRQTASAVVGETPVAPSAVYNPKTNETPRALADEEIEELIEAYATAACRAVSAGFDGIQIHGAHGFLVSQFISPYTNRRDDQWGGSVENRMRFPVEVLHRIRKAVGDTYPVMIKLNSEDFINGGLTIEESSRIAKKLAQDGMDAIEISGGIGESGSYIARKDISNEADEAYYLSNAARFKDVIDVPLMLVGGLRSPRLMERVLEAGEVDMVALCRPFIREPDLVNKWRQGDFKRTDCVSCNGCQKYRDEPVRCLLLD